MVRPLITGVSRICEEVDSIPLDSDERAGGEQAFAALMYQYGGQLDARVLVALWIAGITVPRVIHAVKKKREERLKQEVASNQARVVQGEAIVKGNTP